MAELFAGGTYEVNFSRSPEISSLSVSEASLSETYGGSVGRGVSSISRASPEVFKSEAAKPARIWDERLDKREYKTRRERECSTSCFLAFCKTMKCESSHIRSACDSGVLESVTVLAWSESERRSTSTSAANVATFDSNKNKSGWVKKETANS